MENSFTLEWNIGELSTALRITEFNVKRIFTDGRYVPLIIGLRLVNDHPGWKLEPSTGGGYYLIDPNERRWMARSITHRGVYFNPSNQKGEGREFNEDRFQDMLENLEGFILSDIVSFPNVSVLKVPVPNVIRWYKNESLNPDSSISRANFENYLRSDVQYVND